MQPMSGRVPTSCKIGGTLFDLFFDQVEIVGADGDVVGFDEFVATVFAFPVTFVRVGRVGFEEGFEGVFFC